MSNHNLLRNGSYERALVRIFIIFSISILVTMWFYFSWFRIQKCKLFMLCFDEKLSATIFETLFLNRAFGRQYHTYLTVASIRQNHFLL